MKTRIVLSTLLALSLSIAACASEWTADDEENPRQARGIGTSPSSIDAGAETTGIGTSPSVVATPSEECDAGPQPDLQSCGLWIDTSMFKARARALTPGEEPDIGFRASGGHVSCTDAYTISAKLYYDKSYVHPLPMSWQQ